MKIVLAVPGHLKTVPMNEYVSRTLASLGHEVRLFNFGSQGIWGRALKKISRQFFLDFLKRKLTRLIQDFHPQAFLAIFGFDLDQAILNELQKRSIPTICWWLNDPFQLKRSLAQAPWYDYYFTNARGCLEHYREAGLKQVFYLPVGCYPEVHRLLDGVHKDYEVCFAGDWSPLREEMLADLARNFKVSIWGPWKRRLARDSILNDCIVKDGFFTPEEMAGIFNRSQVVLNIHTWFKKWDYGLNPRVFEANGCGAFQLCDFKEEIAEHYEVGREIVLYRSLSELKDRLGYYLRHPGELAGIAKQGCARTHRDHTYAKRLEEMFSQCGLK